MEQTGINFDGSTVLSALAEGRRNANELKRQLHPSIVSREDCGPLLEKVLSSYDNALSLLNSMGLLVNGDPSKTMLESPLSIEGSPRSEGSDPDSKDHGPRNIFKKRKTLPKWSEQVTELDGQISDGYNWRKYGQKIILGANHPRAYYRCTHRNTQGCLATKQVQRTDEDSSMFEVIYRGKHTCLQERLKSNKESLSEGKKGKETQQRNTKKIKISPELSVLKVEPQQELNTKDETFLSFPFPPTPVEPEDVETGFFSDHGNFASYSNQFLSPSNSESYFSLSPSPCQVDGFSIGHNLLSSDSDFSEIISNPTSVANFMYGDLDISIDQVDFDSHLLDCFS